MKRLRRFVRLSSTEQSRLARALSVLAAIRFGLWLMPFPAVLRVLSKLQPPRSHLQVSEGLSVSEVEVVWAVKAVSRYIPNVTCLTQALAVQFLLARSGYASRIQIGVAQDEESRFEAHAWVECRNAVVIGASGVARFTPLLSVEGGR